MAEQKIVFKGGHRDGVEMNLREAKKVLQTTRIRVGRGFERGGEVPADYYADTYYATGRFDGDREIFEVDNGTN